LAPIDLVVVNLYPFARTVAEPAVALIDALEQIDIGGPTLIRASAKNFPAVLTIVDPGDYAELAAAIEAGQPLPLARRQALAAKAFQHVAAYDSLIATYLRGESAEFPTELSLAADKVQELSYGENPHQQAAFYRRRVVGTPVAGVATARQLAGKELSYNNILDADAAWQAASDFPEHACAIVKHAIPCGLAALATVEASYRAALAGDPLSAFGGIVAVNGVVDEAAAAAIGEVLYHVILARHFTPAALGLLSRRKTLRLLAVAGQATANPGWQWRSVGGGFLVQTVDATPADVPLTPITRRTPTPTELAGLHFAWRAVKHVRSNAIVLAQGHALTGVGPGQPNRVDSSRLAVQRAGQRAAGSVAASDAFFPFADGLAVLAEAGVTAVVHPGGAQRDQEIAALADRYDMAVVTTGMRHFRH
jgi:phosphoribosylaminoimidazolecarboxamide formyltransferase/IMP cyclohydrolase